MLTRNPLRFPALPLFATPLLSCLLALFAVAGGWSPLNADEANEIRTWTSYEGTVLTASYVSSDDKTVTLDRRNGSEPLSIPIERLKFEDQVFVAGMKALETQAQPQTNSATLGSWPDKVAIPAFEVDKKNVRNFLTKNFSFLCELDTSEDYVKEAAAYFEGTLAAVRALPFDLRADPPAGWEQFVVTVGQRASFEGLIAEGARPHPAQRLMAAYLGDHQQLVVPYDSIEGRTREGLPALRLNEDSGVLIHEITHQVTNSSLSLLPYWLSDGLAEYMSLVPMRDGAFHLSRTEVEARLKAVLKDRYGQSSPEIMHPRNLMDPLSEKTWANDVDGHVAVLLSVFYLIHLQHPNAEGKSITTAISTLRAIDDRAWKLISDYNTALDEATPVIEKYRTEFARFKKEAQAYNKRVDAVLAGKPVLVEGGKGAGGRVVVGGGLTAPPVKPSLPKLADILKHQREKPLEVGDFSQSLAVKALLGGSSYQQFADDMKAAYAEIGLSVSFRPVSEQPLATP